MIDTINHTAIKKSSTYLYLVCLVAALGGFLFGFDTAVISGTVSW
jgi:SP family arabinose:H+ symporter-like MFS transporter